MFENQWNPNFNLILAFSTTVLFCIAYFVRNDPDNSSCNDNA